MEPETPTPTPLKIDFDEFTIAEIEQLENSTGVPFGEIGELLKNGTKPAGGVLKGLALIALRRVNPDATEEEAGAIKLKDLFSGVVSADGAVLPPPSPQPPES